MSGPVIGFVSPACGGCGRPPENQCAKCLSYVKMAKRAVRRARAVDVALKVFRDIELHSGGEGRKAAAALDEINSILIEDDGD
jgi:hypothetical protein